MARLEEICSLITDGSHFSPEDEGVGYPMFSVKDMTPNGFNISGCKKIGEEAYKKLVANGCKPLNDDVVVAKDGSYLKTAFVIKGNPEITLLSSIAILRPKIDLVVPEYLSYFLKSDAVYRTVSLNYITGTALKRIILKGIRKIEVDLPDIGEQEQRAQRLSKVDYLCQLRKQQLAKLDELVKARFVEMFGDPINNPMKWIVSKIEDIAAQEKNALKAGPFGSALKKEFYVRSGYKIYGQEQVICGDASFGDYYIDEEKYKELKNCAVQAGDILISLVGTYGKTLIMPDNYEAGIINPRLMKITLNKNKVTPIYFKYYFESNALKASMDANTHGGTMGILNLGIIRQMKIQVPPLSLQNQFAAFVERVDQQKQTVQQSLEKLELLKKALMQEYFG